MAAPQRLRLRCVVANLAVFALVAALAPVTTVAAAEEASGVFVDDDKSIFESDIEWLWGEGITKGCNPPLNDEFCPNAHVTRGQMAAFLVRAMGYTDDGGGDLFKDDDDSIFAADIDRLGAAGVTYGCNPPHHDEFCPNAHVTRGQMAAFLVRAMGYTDDGGGDFFVDDDSTVFAHDIDRLRTAGVTYGCNPPSNDRFCPNDLVTRGQMAAFLHRALGGAQPPGEPPPEPPPPPPPPPADSVTVMGRLVNAHGDPVADAVVTIESDPVVTMTDAEGRFTAKLEPGSHELTAMKDGLVLCTLCFVGVESVTHDLGDLTPGMPSGCPHPDPTFVDLDGDGLSNADEMTGWQVTITLGDGTRQSRLVTSDPLVYDTDDDGLHDGEEKALLTDPTRPDTDADLLGDYGEMKVYKSLPSVADSDGDSCPGGSGCVSNPSLWDGYELLVSKTSPTLADTDGDGLGDYHEIVVGGSNPRLADLPAISLELAADPAITIPGETTDTCTDETISLARESSEHVRTDSEATRMAIENTVRLHTEVAIGTSNWPPSANAELTTDTEFSHSFAQETTQSWTNESLESTEAMRQCAFTVERRWNEGSITIVMDVANESNFALELSELRVLVYRIVPGGNVAFVSTLEPEATWGGSQILAPRSSITMTLETTDVDPTVMRAIVAKPTAFLFEIGSYQLTKLDPAISFAQLSEWVLERTGVVVIDYGDGHVDRHAVATNVYRNPDGSARGISLGEALHDIVGVDYETRASGVGAPVQVLYGLDGRTAYVCDPLSDGYDAVTCQSKPVEPPAFGLWLTAGTGLDGEVTSDFGDIVLSNGDRVVLTYVEDVDGDGILDREEYLLGTRSTSSDSDGDGLDDYFEARQGWDVEIYSPKRSHVFSDPRYADWDVDQLRDALEFERGTDPNAWDTDGDGVDDLFDADPLAGPCRAGENLALETWWDATYEEVGGVFTAIDVWAPEGNDQSNGSMIGDDPASMILENGHDASDVFRLNPANTQSDQRIEVPDDEAVSPYKDFTVSMWIRRLVLPDAPDWQTVVSKGTGQDSSSFRVLVSTDGAVRVSFHRLAHEKCYWDGWDKGCKDDDYWNTVVETTAANVIAPYPAWTYLTVSFNGAEERLRVFANGDLVDEWATNPYWYHGVYESRLWTTHLLDNVDPLTIGGPTTDAGAFQGALDDIQVFHRGLLAEEVSDLYELGVCPLETAAP